MSEPKIGDEVLVRGKITQIDNVAMQIRLNGLGFPLMTVVNAELDHYGRNVLLAAPSPGNREQAPWKSDLYVKVEQALEITGKDLNGGEYAHFIAHVIMPIVLGTIHRHEAALAAQGGSGALRERLLAEAIKMQCPHCAGGGKKDEYGESINPEPQFFERRTYIPNHGEVTGWQHFQSWGGVQECQAGNLRSGLARPSESKETP